MRAYGLAASPMSSAVSAFPDLGLVEHNLGALVSVDVRAEQVLAFVEQPVFGNVTRRRLLTHCSMGAPLHELEIVPLLELGERTLTDVIHRGSGVVSRVDVLPDLAPVGLSELGLALTVRRWLGTSACR
jgi:hypothetical protein